MKYKNPHDALTLSNISQNAIKEFAQAHLCSNLCTDILKLDKADQIISRLPNWIRFLNSHGRNQHNHTCNHAFLTWLRDVVE